MWENEQRNIRSQKREYGGNCAKKSQIGEKRNMVENEQGNTRSEKREICGRMSKEILDWKKEEYGGE